MANNYKINPATRGTNDSNSMEQVACYPIDCDGNDINSSNPLSISLPGAVDDNNSTTTPLLADETYTGTGTEILDFSAICLLVYSDVASANDGLVIDFSADNSDWHAGEAYTIPADSTKFFTPPKQARYYRVRYTNGGSDQTTFHIHATLSRVPIKWSSHNISDNLNDDDDSELVSAVIKLRTAQNNYTSMASTNSGNAKISLEEYNGNVKNHGLPVRSSFNPNEIEEASATVTYIGLESEDGTWYIKKIDTTTGTVFSHATETNNGSYDNYTDAWTNRAALTYGDYGDAF